MMGNTASVAFFCKTYFTLHSLEMECHIWRVLPVLLWLEATLYTLDEMNEMSVRGGAMSAVHCEDSQVWRDMCAELTRLHLMTNPVHSMLAEGRRYWQLERSACRDGR